MTDPENLTYIEMTEDDYDARELLEPLYEEAIEKKQRTLFPIDQAKEIIDQIIETCETDGKRFYDYYFPPSKKSINRFPPSYVSEEVDVKDFSWKRFSDVHDDPEIFINDIKPEDIDQGSLGNCYMIAAISCIATCPELVREAIYPSEWNSAGIFGIKIWMDHTQEWGMVIVDDFFPYHVDLNQFIC